MLDEPQRERASPRYTAGHAAFRGAEAIMKHLAAGRLGW